MKLKSEVVGWVITFVYLVSAGVLFYFKYDSVKEMKLNEIGDFLSGVFGPVAFLWLVLGYLQQGRELKLSSDALLLQASELKNSVEQQAKMAQSASDHLKSAQEANELNKAEVERKFRASFSVVKNALSRVEAPGVNSTKLSISNEGSDAIDVVVVFNPMIKGAPFAFEEIKKQSPKAIPFVSGPNLLNGELEIRYVGGDGLRRSEFFSYTVSPAPFDIKFKKILLNHPDN
jgi:hypothetical protein